ncbi:MAG: hypothetical protein V4574_04975 [Pseudomonadota bacterium]
MDHFTLEPLAARHGDCLLLHFGPSDAPGTVLIDGGPSQVWKGSLKPRLRKLADNRPGGPFAIDLMMVSHIDDDHIRGIVDMTEEWRDTVTDHAVWPFPVRELWHNSFERVAGADPTRVTASLLASFGEPEIPDLDDFEGDHDREATYKILASVGQGAQLRKDAQLLGLPTNSGFDRLVRPGAAGSPFKLGPDLELHVVGPLAEQLDKLQEEFAKELPPLASYADDAVPNLSSIVVLARYKGKTVLLTGDARGDYILKGLEKAGLLTGGKIHIDVLKMQHHASERNTADDFFTKVTADHYVASASGKFENPDRATFEMITRARPKGDRYTIHLTYEVAELDTLRAKEHATARASAIRRGKPPADAWTDETHSLAAFFAACKADGHAFTVETPATRASAGIDLLDPVGF